MRRISASLYCRRACTADRAYPGAMMTPKRTQVSHTWAGCLDTKAYSPTPIQRTPTPTSIPCKARTTALPLPLLMSIPNAAPEHPNKNPMTPEPNPDSRGVHQPPSTPPHRKATKPPSGCTKLNGPRSTIPTPAIWRLSSIRVGPSPAESGVNGSIRGLQGLLPRISAMGPVSLLVRLK